MVLERKLLRRRCAVHKLKNQLFRITNLALLAGAVAFAADPRIVHDLKNADPNSSINVMVQIHYIAHGSAHKKGTDLKGGPFSGLGDNAQHVIETTQLCLFIDALRQIPAVFGEERSSRVEALLKMLVRIDQIHQV